MTALDLWQAFNVKCQRERELGVVNISLAVRLRGGENAVCTLQKLRSEQIAIGNIT